MLEYITSKKLKNIEPSLTIIIDGINLINHPNLNRLLLKTDKTEINLLKIKEEELNIEELFKILSFIQGTALNLSGNQRVLLKTLDSKLIFIDPRLKIPETFGDFLLMMNRFKQDNLVYSIESNSVIMKYVKSELENSIPINTSRFCIYIGEDEIICPKNFIKNLPIAIYIGINPKNKSIDELIEKNICISNDNLSSETLIWRIIKEIENKIF